MTSEQDKFIQYYRDMHAASDEKFPGRSTEKHIPDIADLIQETAAETLLDFGCGKGRQYTQEHIHRQWGGILPTLYDPGVPEFQVKPTGKWDGVICVDVLEHVPEDAVLDVLRDIIGRATNFVFLNVSTRKAGKLLNGEELHCTVHEHDWWISTVSRVKQEMSSEVVIVLTSKKHTEDPIIHSRV